MMACLGKCLGKSSSDGSASTFASKSHPGAQRLNERLRANLNMPLPSLPNAVRSKGAADKPLPPLPLHTATDIELQQNRQQPKHEPDSNNTNTNRPAPVALPWETSRLAQHELTDMYNEVDRTMGHIPYVVCGVGALIDHGFQGRTANKVTIIVPEESRGVVRAWAAAGAGAGSRGQHDLGGAGSDSVAIRMPTDGSLRRVRVRWVSGAAFSGLEIIPSAISRARVLGLASQIDQISTAWLQYRERLAAPGLATQRERGRLERELGTMVRDIFWCLRRAAETRTVLEREYMRLFLSEKVWTPFTQEHEDARFEASRAGIDVAAVLAGHRQRGEVRAHEELLRQYGVEEEKLGGGIVEEQPGPFEGMRGLGRENRKDNGLLSVYTVATSVVSDAAASSVALSDPTPPLPPPKAASSSRQVRDLPGASSSRFGGGLRTDPVAIQNLASNRNNSPSPGRISLEERGRGRKPHRSMSTTKAEKEIQPERQSQHQARNSVDMVSGRGTPEHWF
ncbi:hypothetical protein PG991_010370 [Apiospora marii]|uniref:Uncharacterized protein n=1 Tax=Apiospora marii TaxID=335849 RepID=A0ABR1RJI2_9PEZI